MESAVRRLFQRRRNRNAGTIAAKVSELQLDKFIMKESAFGAFSRLRPQTPKPNVIAQAKRNGLATASTSLPAQTDAQKRELETQRLTMERERLEAEVKLSKLRLELQSQKQKLEQQARAFKQQQPSIDRTLPVIETTETVATAHGRVRIVGIARDNGHLARVEVGGRHVDIERIAEKRARVVLSSGGLEPVADSGGGKHSVFAAQFLKALHNNEDVLDGTQLFEKVRQTVVLNADQTPEYSDIRRAGHEGDDFLFVRKD